MNHNTQHQTPHGGKRRRKWRAGWWGLALAVHLAGLAGFALLPQAQKPTPQATKPAFVPIASAQQRDAVHKARKARAKATAARRPLPLPPAPKPPMPTGQIVEVAPVVAPQAPKEARYLAERDAATEHETRSRHPSTQHGHVMPEPTQQADKAQHKPQASDAADLPAPALAAQAPPQAPSASPMSPPEAPTNRPSGPVQNRLMLRQNEALGHLRNRNRSVGREADNEAPQQVQKAEQGGPRAAPGPRPGLTMADLIPPVGVLARLGGGPSNDALEDLEEGEGTFLNAREFKYASYFMRIKRGVAQRWRAADEYQRRDPTGQIYGYKSRTTGVHVTLDHAGGLKEVLVAQSSGVDFLDREALRAFQAAAPFPNPPKALLDAADQITFRFGFVFSIGRQSFFAAPDQ